MAKPVLNLHRDPILSLLPWIMGLAALVFGLALIASISVFQNSSWGADLAEDEAVIVVPWQVDKLSQKERVNRVIELIIETPNLSDARILTDEEQQRLLEPWLGADLSLNSEQPLEIAIPTLVKLTVATDAQLDTFKKLLSQSVADAQLVLNQQGADVARRTSTALLTMTVLALVLSLGTMILLIIFAVRILLRSQSTTIETLQQLGATRIFIRKQFQAIALRIGLAGGLIALMLLILIAALLWFWIPEQTLVRSWLDGSLLAFVVSLIATPILACLVAWVGTWYGLLQSLVDLENVNKV